MSTIGIAEPESNARVHELARGSLNGGARTVLYTTIRHAVVGSPLSLPPPLKAFTCIARIAKMYIIRQRSAETFSICSQLLATTSQSSFTVRRPFPKRLKNRTNRSDRSTPRPRLYAGSITGKMMNMSSTMRSAMFQKREFVSWRYCR